VVRLVVLWRFRYKLSLRDLVEMFLQRGFVFTHEAMRDWEAKRWPLWPETLRKRRHGAVGNSCGRWGYLYRAVDRNSHVIGIQLSDTRDLAAAEAFFRSAWTVTGVMPARITTDRHDAYPCASRNVFGDRSMTGRRGQQIPDGKRGDQPHRRACDA
jgi:putative transposase